MYKYINKRLIKENKIENEAELADTKVKTEQATNSSQNTHSSEVQLTDKFKIIQKKFNNRNISDALWKELKADSFNLANALGTDAKSNSSWFGMSWLEDRPDPSAFFENEKEAKRILKKYPRTFDVLAELYYRLATRSKDLRTDCKKYLSDSDLKEMRTYYKKYNKVWL